MKITETSAGYSFDGFTEVCEAVLHTREHGNVMLALHEADGLKIAEYGGHDHAWVVGLYQATQDSYNAEQFEYGSTSNLSESFYSDYEEAKLAYLDMLGKLIYDHGL